MIVENRTLQLAVQVLIVMMTVCMKRGIRALILNAKIKKIIILVRGMTTYTLYSIIGSKNKQLYPFDRIKSGNQRHITSR